MLNNSRRKFLRNSSFAFGGLMLVSAKPESKQQSSKAAIGCAPQKTNFALTGTIASLQSGNWSNPSTWGGKVPSTADTPLISSGHTVIYDLSTTTVAGVNVNVGGTLQFDAAKSVTLESTKNVVVQGKLTMKPSSASQQHLLRFTGVVERNFVGGGMTPLATDVGLWVMGSGQLDLIGVNKNAWTRANNSVAAGANSFTATEALSGWAAGDEIFIVPTDAPAYGNTPSWDNTTGFGKSSFLSQFERRTIKSISGSTVTLSSTLSYNHNKVVTDGGKTFTAEVGNLSRNVRIEGTASGKTHVFICSSSVHTLKNVGLRWVGPRKDVNGDGVPDMVAGRYGLHFHHCMFGSKGSIVENCAIYDCGNHAYVPHVSHGITMKNNVCFNTIQTAFWWDYQHITHDTVWDGNLIAACYGIPRTVDTTDLTGETAAGGTGSAMLLGMGDGNIANNNVVVYGGIGDEHGIGGFSWEANNEGVWVFENNLAHGNHCGLRVWQNTSKNHTIINYDSYNNYVGIFHGAYSNSYTYTGGYHYNSLVEIKASSGNSSGVRFENITFDGGGKLANVVKMMPSPSPSGENHNILLRCNFRNYTSAGVIMDTFPISGETVRKHVDLILCTFSAKATAFSSAASSDSFFRIQPASGQANKVGKSSTSNIGSFVSSIWGTGTGLAASYYNGSNFDTFAFSRVDSVIMFDQWRYDPKFSPTGVHYAITSERYSIRWTGKVQAQYSQAYTFKMAGATGYRLWIDGKLVLDSWTEKAASDDYKDSSSVNLVAGQLYDIKMECFNTALPTNCCLYWKCASMDMFRLVPQTQLYSGTVSTTPIPPQLSNQGPVANAGADITIALPTNRTTLNGSGSSDPEGSIKAYRWTKISGPSQYTVGNATASSTSLSNLAQGIYIFQLQVTDDKGATHTDNVVITVNAGTGSDTDTPTLALTASPNPTSSNTRITVVSNVSGYITVRIYDRTGNLIYTRGNMSSNSYVTVGDGAPAGTYIVEAIQGTLRKSITVIKN